MGIRSIFLITDSLYNCDCGWSAVPKKHACALSFQLLLTSEVTAKTDARLALCIPSFPELRNCWPSTRVKPARIRKTLHWHLNYAFGTIYVKEKTTSNQQTNKPVKAKFLNILYPYSFVANINNPGTRHLIKNLQPKLNLQSTILPYI